MVRTDPSTFGRLRFGYMYRFTERLALTGLLGYAQLIDESNNRFKDHSAFTADILFSFYPAKRFFIGIGAGAWNTPHDTTLDAVAEIGFHFMELGKSPSLAVFLEGRAAFHQDSDALPSERIGVGLRLFF